MKNAVIYARFSCSQQNEQSIEGQLRVCYEYAQRHDICIVKEYIDRAKSGTSDARPSFQKMIKDSESQNWDYVLVYKLDRFSRDKYDSAIYKRQLSKSNTKVISATENIPDTPEAIIFESVLEGFAQYYSAELAQKVKRGLKECYIKGQYTGGYRPPFGYDVIDKKVVINEAEAELVKQIYTLYAAGFTAQEIGDKMNLIGVKTKTGKPFSLNYTYKIVTNPKYNGRVIHDGVTYTNIFPKIIDDNLWNAASQRHARNARIFTGLNNGKQRYLLSGKIYCGLCNTKLIGDSCRGRHGNRYFYYSERGAKPKTTDCINYRVKRDYIEGLVLNTLFSMLTSDEYIDQLATDIIDYYNKHNENNAMLNYLEAQLKEETTASENLITAIEMGIITTQTKQKLTEHELRITQLQAEIKKLKHEAGLTLDKKEIIKYVKSVSFDNFEDDYVTKRTIVNTFVKEVVLYDDKIVIGLNFVKPPNQYSPSPEDINEVNEFTEKLRKSPDSVEPLRNLRENKFSSPNGIRANTQVVIALFPFKKGFLAEIPYGQNG